MNIETLTVEYVRTGRVLAELVLSDNEICAGMPQPTRQSLERLRARECPPRNTADIVATVRKALSAADEAARASLNATSSMTPARDKASQRTYCLRTLHDALGAFEAASNVLLDHLAATNLQTALLKDCDDRPPISVPARLA